MSGTGSSRSLGLGLIFAAEVASASIVLTAGFGDPVRQAAAFVIEGGKEALTLGIAGWDLEKARLLGVADSGVGRVPDPVSRLVVFRFPESRGEGLMLGPASPGSGTLREATGGRSFGVEGRVQQVGGRYLPFTLLQLRVEGRPPEPGTPLLDAAGRVAAVAHEPLGEEAFYAVPVEVVRRVLDDSRDGKVSKAWVGIVLNPERGDLRIVRVVDGSPAAQVGLRAGDVLREIGGRRLQGYGDAVNALYLLLPGRGTRFRLERGPAELTLDLTPAVSPPR